MRYLLLLLFPSLALAGNITNLTVGTVIVTGTNISNVVSGGGGGGGFALVSHTSKEGDANVAVTDPQNTVGATLIVIAAHSYQNTTDVGDTKHNTWTAKTLRGLTQAQVQFFYCVNPTTDSAQVFTNIGTGNFPGISVMSFTGNAASPFDVEDWDFTSSTATTRQGNSITPSQDGALVISATTSGLNTFTFTIDSGMGTPDQSVDAANLNYAMSYKVQSTAAAINPTWTISAGGSVQNVIDNIAFKPQ